jgi:hypothetical protein
MKRLEPALQARAPWCAVRRGSARRRGSAMGVTLSLLGGLSLLGALSLLGGLPGSAGAAGGVPETGFRHQASIEVLQPGAFVQLPLPASAHVRSMQAGLADLRVVDAEGQRVPFALLAPRAQETQHTERLDDAALYPLPARPAPGNAWASPLEVVVQGDRISVKRAAGATALPTPGESPGWLFDLGERERDLPAPQALRLAWSGPLEFSAGFSLETSDDLQAWRPAGRGQVMALSAAIGSLSQPLVKLAGPPGRFVRLVWLDAANAPRLSGAKVVAPLTRSQHLDPPTSLEFAATAEPTGKRAKDEWAAGALHFDLGGVLPLEQLDLAWPTGTTRVLPARVQGRSQVDEPWRDLAQAVFYRLERGTDASVSPPLALLGARVRYVRVVPDRRAAALDGAAVRLLVQAPLGSLVFASQGQPPYRLLAGQADALTGALPVATLVPALEDERPRFGRANLGPWTEVAAVAQAQQAEQRRAALRPWLLWAVLVLGVAGLGFMVWRLARPR